MKILAIDPGYERLGIAVLEKVKGGKEILLHSECFQTKASLPFPERLGLIGKRVDEIIAEFKPEALAIEKLFFTNNQKTAIMVAETCGVIIFCGVSNGLVVQEYTPPEIKVATTGDGRSDKRQIISMVPKLIRIEKVIKHDDEYDAIAIGLTFFACYRPSK